MEEDETIDHCNQSQYRAMLTDSLNQLNWIHFQRKKITKTIIFLC